MKPLADPAILEDSRPCGSATPPGLRHALSVLPLSSICRRSGILYSCSCVQYCNEASSTIRAVHGFDAALNLYELACTEHETWKLAR